MKKKVENIFTKKKSPSKRSPSKRSPSRLSPSKLSPKKSLSRSSSKKKYNLENIKNQLNYFYYKIIDIIKDFNSELEKGKLTKSSPLQEKLKLLINTKKENFEIFLSMNLIKKNTLEETLFILSLLISNNCNGFIIKAVCDLMAKQTNLQKIYELLTIKKILLKQISGNDFKEKLEFISLVYKNNTDKLQNIKKIINEEFDVNKMINILIEIMIADDKIFDDNLLIELKDEYNEIKNNILIYIGKLVKEQPHIFRILNIELRKIQSILDKKKIGGKRKRKTKKK